MQTLHLLLALCVVSSASALSFGTNETRNDFTFANSQAFIELQPQWPLHQMRRIAFRFKTLLPQALLVYQGIIGNKTDFGNYELFVKLENARLKVIHIVGTKQDVITLGKALSKNVWHQVSVVVEPANWQMGVSLNDEVKTIKLEALSPTVSLESPDVSSLIYLGGLNPNHHPWKHQVSYKRFVGCLGDVHLEVDNNEVFNLEATSHLNVQVGCLSRCYPNACLNRGKCINHYNKIECDCYGTGHEGPNCLSEDLSTVTFRGYSFLTYRMYDWDSKVHTDSTRISLTFRTNFDNSVLFYSSGEKPQKNYISAKLIEGKVHFTIDTGDGPISVSIGQNLNNNWWHTLVINHQEKTVTIQLDRASSVVHLGHNYFLHLDSDFYVGGIPEQKVGGKIHNPNKFVGSMMEIYFNSESILERLKKRSSNVIHHSFFSPEFGFQEVKLLPITFPYQDSGVHLYTETTDSLNLSFEFKTEQKNVVLAYGSMITEEGIGYWELRLQSGVAKFTIVRASLHTPYTLSKGTDLNNYQWHYVLIKYKEGHMEMVIDYWHKEMASLEMFHVSFDNVIHLATSNLSVDLGFIGCMRDIKLHSTLIDSRSVLSAHNYTGEVNMDNCQLVDPCKRPGQCEHGGQCLISNGKITCNCNNTGYTGATCHFSLFKRSCEELFLVGYKEPGVYMIDIDGNGPLRPAPVICDINPDTGVITTRVDHNIERDLVVRKPGLNSFQMKVTYREFTSEMLQTLIKHSKNCSQTIRYDCFKVPLGLRSYTWFKSSYNSKRYIQSLGSKNDGYCPCGETRSCANSTKLCNCDSVDNKWRSDHAAFHDPQFLGITELFFLQPKNMAPDSKGLFSLGPLECTEMDTQHYVITFKTPDSYLEVPGWRSGDLAFSFRTSNKRAILLYQPSILENNYFRVTLIDEYQLHFDYTVDGKNLKVEVTSSTPLNSGEWQQVWVDYDPHHVRFTLNMDSKMMNLNSDDQFGPFEGSLYVGGAPMKYLMESGVTEGFVGCFRGLVLNDEIFNLYSYLSSSIPAVVEGCKPSCDPNPCQNGATCHEFWGSYKCECSNSLAHSGKHCEKNINTNSITFVTGSSHYQELFEDKFPPFLTEDILFSIRTYNPEGLILYAHDHFNNFVQLHIQNGDELVFQFNSQREVKQRILKFPELTRGIPVQVLVERKPTYSRLIANEHQTIINAPLVLVDKYRQNPWIEGEDLENVKPPRPPVEPKSYLQYFLGGVDENMETQLAGFVGCLMGLRVGEIIDLENIVRRNPGGRGFRMDCKMSCDSEPCKNNGYCIEDWKNINRQCDCTFTSFFGKSCDEEKAGSFDGRSFIKYKFFPDSSIYEKVQIRIAFSTAVHADHPSFLLFVNSKVDERNYIYIALLPDGKLKFEEDDGTGKIIQLISEAQSGNFYDGRRHWVYYARNDDTVSLIVDGVEHSPNITDFDNIVSESDPTKFGGDVMDVVILGGFDFRDNRFAEYVNYTGCLSNVMVEVDTFNIYPLETTFGYRPGGEKLQLIGTIHQTKCSTFQGTYQEATTPPSINLTGYVGQSWDPPKANRIPFSTNSMVSNGNEWEVAEANAKRVALAMGAFLLVIVIALGIYLWRVDWKDKQYKYEEAQEKPFIVSKKIRLHDGNPKTVGFSKPTNGVRLQDPEAGAERIPLQKSTQPTISPKSITTENPLQHSSSQELEWDPVADNADLIGSVEDLDGGAQIDEADVPTPLPVGPTSRAPLGNASEVTLST